MRLMGKIFRWLFCLLGISFFLVLLLVVLAAVIQIPIDLTGQKSFFESIFGNIMDRKVAIEGQIKVNTSLHPSFAIHGIRIANREGFQKEDYIFIRAARVQLNVLPLLKGKISLREFSSRGFSVTLLENEQGMNNWSTAAPDNTSSTPDEKGRKRFVEVGGLASDSLVIDRIFLENIAVSFITPDMQEPFNFTIQECEGNVKPGIPTSLFLSGSWQTHPFTSNIKIGSLQELVEQDRSWMHIATDIAKTRLEFEGKVDLVTVLDSLSLKAEIRGEKLDSLNELLQVEMPPLKDYAASAELTLRQKRLALNKLHIQVGDSSFEGNMSIDATGRKPAAQMAMRAPMIRLDDFIMDDDALEISEPLEINGAKSDTPDKERTPAPKTEKQQEKTGSSTTLFSQEVLQGFDAKATLQLHKVLSGEDFLGGGEITLTLHDGRLSIEPLQLELPGGSLFYAMSLEPGREKSKASLRIRAENFDIGIAARRARPETDMGGVLNLDVDLQSSGGSIEEILANGSGYIDFSARPVNLNSGVMDLWVVNLLVAIIFRSDEKGSPINCMISRWSMKDGVLTPDAFAVDTTIMRICGSGKIDLKENTIDLRIAPSPKREQFFSLATPFSIKGRIQDIKVGIAPGGLLGTSIRFIASPGSTPLSWFLGQKIPGDGSDICTLPIGADNRPEKSLPGCRKF